MEDDLDNLKQIDESLDVEKLLSNDIPFVYDVQKDNYIYVSPSIERFTSKPAEYFANTDFQYFLLNVHPDDIKEIKEILDRLKNKISGPVYETALFRFRNFEGNWAWFKADFTCEFDEKGQPTFVRGVARLVDNEKRLQLKMNEAMEKQTLLNSMIDKGVFEVDLRDYTAILSPELQSKLGIEKPKWKLSIFDLRTSLHPIDNENLIGAFREYISGRSGEVFIYEFRVDIFGKGYRWYRIRLAVLERSPAGEPVKLLGIAVELMSPAGAKTTITNSITNIISLFDQFPDGIIIINDKGRLEAVNLQATKILRLNAKDIIGKTLWSVIINILPYEKRETFSIDKHAKYISDYLKTGVSESDGKDMTLSIRRGDGSQTTITLRTHAIKIEKAYNLALIIKEKS